MNCWEFHKCGRQRGGANVQEMGVCPAYPNYGHLCAKVAGTLCGGRIQGSFAAKLVSCMACDFYNSPHHEKPRVGAGR